MPWEAYSGLLNIAGTWMYEAELPVALHGETAYVATTDRLLVFDTTNQVTRATIRPEGGEPITTLKENERNRAAPPVITEGDTPLVLAPFLIQQAGVGTQAARSSAELVATDTKTGKAAWRLSLPLPAWTKDAPEPLTAEVVGTAGNIAIVTLAHQGTAYTNASTTYAIDLTGRQVLWSQETFWAATVVDGILVGQKKKTATDDYSTAVGYDLTTGAVRWQGQEHINMQLRPAGPNLLHLYARDKGDYRIVYEQFLDVRTGEVRQNAVPVPARCRHDGASAVVCWGPDRVRGFDATTGAILWQLPDEKAGRIAPQVTTVWHGRVYAKTAGGTVALDSRTGADLPTPPVIAPDLVNAYTGIAISKSGDDVTAYQSAS
ncbi:PQQ-binding-like beta-propeller repeat protein [Streptomyces sp. NPDC096339]|uniref:outer membrane protein assembly factor BamB family protein n=1 Tax=Streptomyces sp. NPDC096339 TaxID=3366086 RepID=UPI003828AAB3